MSARQLSTRRQTDQTRSQRSASDRTAGAESRAAAADRRAAASRTQRPLEGRHLRASMWPVLPPLHPSASATTLTLPTNKPAAEREGACGQRCLPRGRLLFFLFFSLAFPVSPSLPFSLPPPISRRRHGQVRTRRQRYPASRQVRGRNEQTAMRRIGCFSAPLLALRAGGEAQLHAGGMPALALQ